MGMDFDVFLQKHGVLYFILFSFYAKKSNYKNVTVGIIIVPSNLKVS
jgi:hypothetical protein